MEIRRGAQIICRDGITKTAIIEFVFENYILYVFQGGISEFDILIKYRKGEMRLRTPKHIHWVIDILIKMQYKKELVRDFLYRMKDIWESSTGLQDNSYEALKRLIEEYETRTQMERFEELSQYGEYPIDFLFVLMELLSTQEKTNREDAYMFGQIIDELLEEDFYFFWIVSRAGFTGRG